MNTIPRILIAEEDAVQGMDLQHLNQILRALRDINQLITREHDAQRLMQAACNILVRMRGYRFVWIGEPAGDMLKPVAYAGEGIDLVQRINTSATPEQASRLPGIEALHSRQVVLCQNMPCDERYSIWREQVEQFLFYSAVAIPLAYEDALLGVLIVYTDQTNLFDQAEVDLLLELAGDIAFGANAIAQEVKRGKLEEARRLNEAQFRAAFKTGLDGFYVATLEEGLISEMNDEFQNIFGYPREETIGKTSLELGLYEDPADRARIVAELKSKGSVKNTEVKGRKKSGEIIICSLSISVMLVNGTRHILGVIRDITESKRTAQSLGENTERLRLILENSQDAPYRRNLQSNSYDYLGPSFEQVSGFTAQEMNAMSVEDVLAHMQPDDAAEVARRLSNSMGNPGNPYQAEYRFRHKDGRFRWFQDRFTTTLDGQGRPLFLYGSVRDITESKREEEALQVSEQAARYMAEQLQMVNRIGVSITAGLGLERLLQTLYEQCQRIGDTDTFYVALYDEATGMASLPFYCKDGGRQTLATRNIKEAPGTTGYIVEHRQTLHIPDLMVAHPGITPYRQPGIPTGSFIGVPLVLNERVIGVLSMQSHKTNAYTPRQIQTLELLATQVAIALQNSRLYEKAQRDAAELVLAYDMTLEGWAHALELRDHDTEGHARRVVGMTLDLARAMSVGQGEMDAIRRGALLHDIGKMGIPDSVLRNPGTLNEREWEIMRRHPEYAYAFLSPIEYLKPALDIPYCHHEKWDGTGYPRGLQSESIPLAARIFAIVDVWDALTNNRTYRTAWAKEKALSYIRDQSGKHFDPRVVEVFMTLVS